MLQRTRGCALSVGNEQGRGKKHHEVVNPAHLPGWYHATCQAARARREHCRRALIEVPPGNPQTILVGLREGTPGKLHSGITLA